MLLWNYPGQAFTEWRPEQLLNNEYIASCLNEVLGQVGSRGTNDFDTDRPFYIMGYGNGCSVSAFYGTCMGGVHVCSCVCMCVCV